MVVHVMYVQRWLICRAVLRVMRSTSFVIVHSR